MADLVSTPGGDITGIASSSSSSSGTPHGHVYDIFLNHRGEKKNLASKMYRRLIVRGFRVFLDAPELEKGEDIFSQIKEAIRTASLHVAIFSPAYAQSRWCLEELALMLESGSTIIPVFIDVDPKQLRWTNSGNGRYAQDLQILEKKTTMDPNTRETKPRHDSVGQLTGLQTLGLRWCSSLQGLPDSVGQMTGVQTLDLWGCSSLQGLPHSVGQLTGLQTLDLLGCSSLQGLPHSVGQLTGLQTLNLWGCSSLEGLPDSMGQLTDLQTLNLESCFSVKGFPNSVENLTRLKYLYLSRCSNLQMPPNVQHLSSLVKLDVSKCYKLQWGAGIVEELRQRLGTNFKNIEPVRRPRGGFR